jgi:hypothetical protein
MVLGTFAETKGTRRAGTKARFNETFVGHLVSAAKNLLLDGEMLRFTQHDKRIGEPRALPIP